MTEQPKEQRFEVEISAEAEQGVHADFASLWHTPDTFVLDFASMRRPAEVKNDPNTDKPFVAIPTRIVSRVKIPPAQVFQLMRALEQQLTNWEQETGKRQSPGDDPDLPPLT